MDSSSFASSLAAILILILVLSGAYFAARMAGLSMKRVSGSRYMKILDRVSISKDYAVVLVQVGDRVFVVGTAAHGMEKIAELSLSELKEVWGEKDSRISFNEIWRSALKNSAILHTAGRFGSKEFTDEEIQ